MQRVWREMFSSGQGHLQLSSSLCRQMWSAVKRLYTVSLLITLVHIVLDAHLRIYGREITFKCLIFLLWDLNPTPWASTTNSATPPLEKYYLNPNEENFKLISFQELFTSFRILVLKKWLSILSSRIISSCKIKISFFID